MDHIKPMAVAIIGMSCRFSGHADTPERLWELASKSRSGWSTFPPERLNHDAFYHPVSDRLNASSVKGAHFLKEDISLFDSSFFNLSAETAAVLDPQIRMQLETTFEAFESAGLTLEQMAGTTTAVFAGLFLRDYYDSLERDPETLPRHFTTSTSATMASARISHFYDLRGPSMTIDTACSTSITALHQACNSLRLGEAEMAVVTGANLMLNPDNFNHMSAAGFLSEDGRSFSFDTRASGYGRGEGIATLILKPLEQARLDNDPIRAIIRGTAINQDGRTPSITSPSMEAQQRLINSCYQQAELDPLETAYVEAHGTGTQTGDVIEAQAIYEALGGQRPDNQPLYVGSIKSNIGHCEAASGLAGIVKVVMAFEKGMIPPNFDFQQANPKIPFDHFQIKVPTQPIPWPDGNCKRASLNSFGYGGSNGHVILEEPVALQKDRSRIENPEPSSHVFIVSGKDRASTDRKIAQLKDYVSSSERARQDESRFLRDLAYTLGQRRSRHLWTATTAASNTAQLIDLLDPVKMPPCRKDSQSRVGFVFTGQGAQWHAMGRELLVYPVFHDSILEAEEILRSFGCPWNVTEELGRDPETSRIQEPVLSVPLCCIIQMSLVRLLHSWGVRPTAVTGHSSGEIAAAFAANALTMKEALAVAWSRGQLTQEHQIIQGRKGGMMAVGISRQEAQECLHDCKQGTAVVACVNSPSSVTLSGDLCAIKELENKFRSKDVFVRQLKVNAAYHSDHMQVFADSYLLHLQEALSNKGDFGTVMFSSSTTGERVAEASELNAQYWVRNMLQPVEFLDSFTNMCLDPQGQKSVDIVIEIGPHHALAGPIRQILAVPKLKHLGIQYASCLTRDQNAVTTMHALVCFLVRRGLSVDLGAVNFPKSDCKSVRTLTDLPKYPWNHGTSHWVEPRLNRQYRLRSKSIHDLLGVRIPGMNPNMPTWRNFIRQNEAMWIRDHQLQSTTIFPAAGYISMAIEAVRQIFDGEEQPSISEYRLQEIEFKRALMVPEHESGIELQLQLRLCDTACDWKCQQLHRFLIHSVTQTDVWTEHCTGYITIDRACLPRAPSIRIQSAAKRTIDTSVFYDSLQGLGVQHGPAFQTLISIDSDDCGGSITKLKLGNTKSLMPGGYESQHVIHPITLDSIIVSAFTARPKLDRVDETGMVPRSIRSLNIRADIPTCEGSIFQVHTKAVYASPGELVASSSTTTQADTDQSVVDMDGLCLRSLGPLRADQNSTRSTSARGIIVWEACQSLDPSRSRSSVGYSSSDDRAVTIVHHKSNPPEIWRGAILKHMAAITEVKVEHCALLSLEPTAKNCIFLELEDAELVDPSREVYDAIKNTLTTAESIIWVSRGSTMDCPNPTSALSQGLLRTLRCENQFKRYFCLDLDPNRSSWTLEDIEAISQVYRISCTEPSIEEFEYAERNNILRVPRLRVCDGIETRLDAEELYSVPEVQHRPAQCLQTSNSNPSVRDAKSGVEAAVDRRQLRPVYMGAEGDAFRASCDWDCKGCTNTSGIVGAINRAEEGVKDFHLGQEITTSNSDSVSRNRDCPFSENSIALGSDAHNNKQIIPPRETLLSSDGLYVIVGGMGGIGQSISRELVKLGARRLLIISRSAERSIEGSQEFLAGLSKAGCDVVVRSCDIASKSNLAQVIGEVEGDKKLVRGIIQAAMVLMDSIFEQMSWENYLAAVQPKVVGTWNLHEQFANHDLDFFIILSSFVGVGGNPGQANYAAGNAFQDAVAHHRANLGLPAVTIDLGAVEGVGYLANHVEVAESLARKGYKALSEREVLTLVEDGIRNPIRDVQNAQIVTGFQTDDWKSTPWSNDARFIGIKPIDSMTEPSGKTSGMASTARFAQASSLTELKSMVISCLTQKLSDMFSIPEPEIDTSKALAHYGVDSLVAIELRNWLTALVKADVSIFEIMQSTSLNVLVDALLKKSYLSLPFVEQSEEEKMN